MIAPPSPRCGRQRRGHRPSTLPALSGRGRVSGILPVLVEVAIAAAASAARSPILDFPAPPPPPPPPPPSSTHSAAGGGEEEYGADEDDDDDDAKRLDYSMRRLFLEAARRAVPWRAEQDGGLEDVRDGLEIDERCTGQEGKDEIEEEEGEENKLGVVVKVREARERKAEAIVEEEGGVKGVKNDDKKSDDEDEEEGTFRVCPLSGDDVEGDGTKSKRFRTVRRALEASRHFVTHHDGELLQQTRRRTILLRPGTVHYLEDTIELGPEDSYLMIRSDERGSEVGGGDGGNDRVWISGGVPVLSSEAGWKRKSPDNPVFVADLSSLLPPPPDGSDGDGDGGDDNYYRSFATGLFTVDPHRRMTLARYPNANVEDWDAPDRYLSPSDSVTEWIFPPTLGVPEMYTIDISQPGNPTGHLKNDSAMVDYNKLMTGRGGACSSVWGDRPSYWCGEVNAGGWAEVDRKEALSGRLNLPAGVKVKGDVAERAAEVWTEEGSRGAIVHVAHTQGWAWHMFNVSSVELNDEEKKAGGDDNATPAATLHFDKGGWQGGKNWQCRDWQGHLSDCDGPGKTLAGGGWYVEGVREELDEKGEFYFDAETKELYFYPPKPERQAGRTPPPPVTDEDGSSASTRGRRLGADDPPPSATEAAPTPEVPDLVVTKLQTLLRIRGTGRANERTVRGIELQGLSFRDAAKTYMEPWSAPSGGDWALHRGGAIHVDGYAEDLTIEDCAFRRLDGNAVMLSGRTRNVTVTKTEFAWIGDGAIATWGDTRDNGYDATQGDQPRFTLVESNVMSNLGLYQKQSSGFGSNKACENTMRNNVTFNLPRVAVNFNDGLGGNNLVEGNVIFNTCRESGDHGPINSWDRMPFLANTAAKPEPSFQPATTHTVGNLILSNYGASQGFDNDDGSSYYYTHDNVYYDSDGFKMDYGGHDSVFGPNNLVYSAECFGTGSFKTGHTDKFHDNKCIRAGGHDPHSVGDLFQCNRDGLILYNNSYYTVNGNVTWTCPGVGTFTLSQMHDKGMENGMTVGVTLEADVIVGWVREILKLCLGPREDHRILDHASEEKW